MKQNPNFPERSQKDYTKEYHQLRPRSLRSNGTELDESVGEIGDVRRDVARLGASMGDSIVRPEPELSSNDLPENPLDEPEDDSEQRVRRGSR